MSSKKVLLVDDSAELLEIYSDYLISNGFLVTTLSEPALLPEVLNSQHFDFVVCDYNMPAFNFKKEIAVISTLPYKTKVIVMTGDPLRAHDLSIPFPILMKPFPLSELKSAFMRGDDLSSPSSPQLQ